MNVTDTTIAYQTWSPETGASRKLRTPVPYRTFSETFSYHPGK